MTRPPEWVKQSREALGMTQDQLAGALHMGADGKRAVRRWEHGEREISGPAEVAIEALLSGWRPANFGGMARSVSRKTGSDGND